MLQYYFCQRRARPLQRRSSVAVFSSLLSLRLLLYFRLEVSFSLLILVVVVAPNGRNYDGVQQQQRQQRNSAHARTTAPGGRGRRAGGAVDGVVEPAGDGCGSASA